MTAVGLDKSKISDIALLRLVCVGNRGCKQADVKVDLWPFVSHRLSQGEWRSMFNDITGALETGQLILKNKRGRYISSEEGTQRALDFLGLPKLPTKDWKDIKSLYLVAKALKINSRTAKQLKSLKTSDGLRAAILKYECELPLKTQVPTSAQVLNTLAINAIGEAFDESLDKKINGSTHLPEKLTLFLASRNLHRPREIGSSSQLLAALAAEALGAARQDPNSLRLILLRRFVSSDTVVNKPCKTAHKGKVKTTPAPLDLASFASLVHKHAKNKAVGWPGNKRAYISHIWETFQTNETRWSLDETEFKNKLTEAHCAGYLTLAVADLRDKSNIKDVQDSATRYKNSEWHLVRLED